MHAQLLKATECGARSGVCEDALCELQLQQCRGQAVFLQGAQHELRKFSVLELLCRDVESETRRSDIVGAPGS